MFRALRIEVWFDLICPWCLIGHQQLKRTLAQWHAEQPDVPAHVRWRSVQLIPQVPPEGWPFQAFYDQRLGSAEAVRARQAQVLAAAAAAGIVIDFSRITTFPNTARAHALLKLASARLEAPAQDRLLRRLFAAYFELGQDLDTEPVLLAIAAEHGLPEAEVACCLQGENPPAAQDVPGVPFFVFNQQIALSGAQAPEALLKAMRQAASPLPVA